MPRDPSSEETETHGGEGESREASGRVRRCRWYCSLEYCSREFSRVTAFAAFETRLVGGVRLNPKEDSNAGSWAEELVSLGSGSKSLTKFTTVQDIMDEGYSTVRCRRRLGKGL